MCRVVAQVEPTLMNVADGATVSREISAQTKASTGMVGNPPQTLTPEFRGNVSLSQQNKNTPTSDCKTLRACLDSGSSSHQPNNAAMSGEKRADKRLENSKIKVDGIFSSPPRSGGVKASCEDSNPCHSNVMSGRKAQSLSAGFQCSAMFKPAPPVAFLPSPNFSSPLCKITLPPALGQITALREATSGQFHKNVQPQTSGLLRSYPYQFSVGRTSSAERKSGSSSSKLKSNHSLSRNSKSAGEHKSLASVVAPTAMALPLQHPSMSSAAPTHYTISPTAAICCGSALASITSQSRLLNHVEKNRNSLKTSLQSASEDRIVCPGESRDVPLDLSAKSKRPKCIGDAPASPLDTHGAESNPKEFLNSKRSYSSAVQFPVLPNTHRNGSHPKHTHNHQTPDHKAAWGKGSSEDSIKNIPGTYVGVASPILASTLRGKDGKGTFADELQSFAKQELISIVDQGEHVSSGGKKLSCAMKSSQHSHGVAHAKNTSTAITKNGSSKGALKSALSSSNSNSAGAYSTSVSPTWLKASHLPHPGQKKGIHASPKTKGTAGFPGHHRSQSCPDEDQWEALKSPLSSLTSVIKQQPVETSEAQPQPSPVAAAKTDLPKPGSHEPPPKRSAFPSYWSVEKWHGAASPEPLENHQDESGSERIKKSSLKPGQPHPFSGCTSAKEKKTESKLAQVLEGDMLRTEGVASLGLAGEHAEGKAKSVLTGQGEEERGGRVRENPERETNGTKEESPGKSNPAAAVKQKKGNPKKVTREKTAETIKKAAEKKQNEEENTPNKIFSNKKVNSLKLFFRHGQSKARGPDVARPAF